MIVGRIKDYIDEKGISVAAFERSIGMSNASFGKCLKNNGAIGTDKLEKILSTYSDISPSWLLTGDGPMLKDEAKMVETDTDGAPHVAVEPEKLPEGDLGGLPLITEDAMAGFPSFDVPGILFNTCEHYRIPEFEERGAHYIIRVSGNSMHPTYQNGDLLGLRRITDVNFFQWGEAYVLDTNQGVLVKRVFPVETDPDSIQCVSDNPKFPPYTLCSSDIRSVNVIVGLVRLS